MSALAEPIRQLADKTGRGPFPLSGDSLKFLQQAFLGRIEFPGDRDAKLDNLVPATGAVEDRHPLAGKLEEIPILRPGRNRQFRFSPQRRNRNLCAQSRLGHADWDLAENIIAIPFKKGVAFDGNSHIKITNWSSPPTGLSLAGKEELRAAPDTRRYFQRNRGGSLDFSASVAIFAGGFQTLTLPLTVRTGDGEPEQVAAMGERSAAMTEGAGDPAGARLCA